MEEILLVFSILLIFLNIGFNTLISSNGTPELYSSNEF